MAITFSFQVTWSIARSTSWIVFAAPRAVSPTSVSISRPQIAYLRAYAVRLARTCTGPCTVRQIRSVTVPLSGAAPPATSTSGVL
jgi:hypothetical protein